MAALAVCLIFSHILLVCCFFSTFKLDFPLQLLLLINRFLSFTFFTQLCSDICLSSSLSISVNVYRFNFCLQPCLSVTSCPTTFFLSPCLPWYTSFSILVHKHPTDFTFLHVCDFPHPTLSYCPSTHLEL